MNTRRARLRGKKCYGGQARRAAPPSVAGANYAGRAGSKATKGCAGACTFCTVFCLCNHTMDELPTVRAG